MGPKILLIYSNRRLHAALCAAKTQNESVNTILTDHYLSDPFR